MNRFLLFIIFIVLLFFSYTYLDLEKEKNIDIHINKKTKEHEQNFNIVYQNLQKHAELIYDTQINTDEVKNLLVQTINASKEKKNEIRAELFNKLQDTYKILKKYQIKQLHFHLPNNDSFLRFHRPNKFGDNLTDIRATVAYVNKYKKPIDGFEEGRIYNGFRFVLPLTKDNIHLGSVEVSFSTLFVNIEMMEHFDVIGKILIDKTIVEKKVWNDEKSNYASSKIDGYLFEKKIEKALEIYNTKNIPIVVSKNTVEKVKENKNNPESFSLYDKDSNTIMTFVKLVNPITKKVVGMFVLRSDSSYIKEQEFTFFKFLFGFFLLLSVIFVFIDRVINERKRLQKLVEEKTSEIEHSNHKLQKYIDLLDRYVITSSTNLDGIITESSQAFSNISGYTKDELIGKPHNIIRHPDMSSSFYAQLWKTLQSGKMWQGEMKNKNKNGGTYWVYATISQIYDKKGNHIGYTAIRQDISNKKHIETIAITDALTCIFNRRHFNSQLPRILNSARRNNLLISLVMLDIDHFKQYNDNYGHQKGDEALKSVADVLVRTLKRSSDVCFRIGGEEFAIIYVVDTKEQSLEFANKIRIDIESLHLQHAANIEREYVTVSLGLVCKNANDIINEDTLFKEADDYLYKAKQSGRNKVISNI